MKIIFLFSGQGSQYYQMGRKLFDSDSTFRKHMYEQDEIVRASHEGISIVEEVYNTKYKLFDPFSALKLTHPAIFMVEYALVKVLERQGIVPDFVLGCSLGEITAATVAGVLSVEDALKLIIKQAEIVEKECRPGRMVAVLQDLNAYQYPEIKNFSDVAAINAPSQFVISGEKEKLGLVMKFMKDRDMLHQELVVSYGFHSSSIAAAEIPYKAYLQQQKFQAPTLPVVSGVSGLPIERFDDDYLWNVVRKLTDYAGAVKFLESAVGSREDLMYLDLGPAGSLANLVKYNISSDSTSKGFQIMTPFQQEQKKLDEAIKFYKENRKLVVQTSNRNRPLMAYVFPGQGSQRKGMGEDLFEVYPKLTDQASEILGCSIRDLCLDSQNKNLNLTQFTQPALYVVNALSYLKLREESGITPDFVAGHSLGEYNALFAAGVFDFATGLKLVKKRGSLMAGMKEGGMAAVKGLTEEQITNVIRKHGLDEIDIANFNTENQIVLSGPRELIHKSGSHFEIAGATLYFPLNVSGAFHSRYMNPAKEEFELFLRQFKFSKPNIPVISNVEASFYSEHKIIQLLANQLVKPVRWTESINFLLQQGEITFKEVGPGDVLTKLVWRIQQDHQVVMQ